MKIKMVTFGFHISKKIIIIIYMLQHINHKQQISMNIFVVSNIFIIKMQAFIFQLLCNCNCLW